MHKLKLQVEEGGFRTIGEYQFSLFVLGDKSHPNFKDPSIDGLNNQQPSQKIRTVHVLREMYVEELNLIWKVQQQFHSVLTDELLVRLRDKVIFYQRPLKPSSHLKAKCRFEPRKRVIPKSHPHFQEFRTWQALRNLTIKGSSELESKPPTLDEMKGLATYLFTSDSIDRKALNSILRIDKSFEISEVYDQLKGNTTYAKIIKAIGKGVVSSWTEHQKIDKVLSLRAKRFSFYQDLDEKKKASFLEDGLKEIGHELGLEKFIILNEEVRLLLWEALYFFEDEKKLEAHIEQKFGFDIAIAKQLSKVSLEPDYGSLSHRALTRSKLNRETGEIQFGILHYLKQGELYNIACEKAGYMFNEILNSNSQIHDLIENIEDLKHYRPLKILAKETTS